MSAPSSCNNSADSRAPAPYFSNGSAATLKDVVDFYDHRYAIGYSEKQKQDLVNFLRSL